MCKKVAISLKPSFVYKLIFALLLHSPFLTGKDKKNRAVFTSNIKMEASNLKLKVGFCKYYINGVGNETTWKDVKVDKNGNFKFLIEDISGIGRVVAYEYENYIQLLKSDLVEPGDSINIQINAEEGRNITNFNGRGDGKYRCRSALDTVNYNIFYDYRNDADVNLKFDSLKNEMLNILDAYKKDISDSAYNIMYNDVVGKLAYAYIYSVYGDIPDSLDKVKYDSIRVNFRKFNQTVAGNGNYEYLSTGMISYLFDKEKIDMMLERNGKNPAFESFYARIKNTYDGKLREQLIAYCFKNKLAMAFVFGGADPLAYKKSLEDALKIVSTPVLRNAIMDEYNKRAQGAKIYNFALPKDSSNQLVHFSDLKGKVILLDVWSYNCTGCYLFSRAFHEKIFPLFQADTNFLVVSVMLDKTAGYEHYLRRLRRMGNTTYTYPEYLNLYGGKDVKDAMDLIDYYNIDIYPTIFVINKNGELVSSTIPYFNDSQSPNVPLLTELIRKTLTN